jgi:hypothetical protein
MHIITVTMLITPSIACILSTFDTNRPLTSIFNIFYLTYDSMNCSIHFMEPKTYFIDPASPTQRRYEALRAFYADGLSAAEAADKFAFSPSYFKKLRFEFVRDIKEGANQFFPHRKTGPKERFTNAETIQRIITLRKRNFSITDIKVTLDAEGTIVSLDTIDKILKAEGFAPLPKRTNAQRLVVTMPEKLKAPKTTSLEILDEEFTTETGAGPLVFLPLLEELRIIEAIKEANFPATNDISAVQSVLSFLALKLMGAGKRWSHDTLWNMDRALGLFAGLNVLPKSTTLSTYSYGVTREMNKKLLVALSRIFKDERFEEGEFNLDFKAIPHWGDESVLERNWAGTRSKAIKSLMALIVEEPSTRNLSYTNADIKHRDQNEALLEFVDFWKEGRGNAPKMLIFDSKFTTYKNLNELNKSKEKIKFLTLRRRSKSLIEKAGKLPEAEWKLIKFDKSKRRHKSMRVHDGRTTLKDYEGEVRQIILTDHGREKPTFLVTNDFNLDLGTVVEKYARRWLVEQEIAEQISFFHLNNPSSSIVVKVDFDLTLSLLAHNLYGVLTRSIRGFEHCNVDTIYRKFLQNGARVNIKDRQITVKMKKKTHLPLLFELPWLKKCTHLSWMGIDINFEQGSVS